MTKLNQIIAIEKGAKAESQRALTVAYHDLQRSAQWSGIARQYSPKDEEGEQLPPESTKVQVRGEPLLDGVAKALARLFDITATKDAGNTVAKADVVVDGVTILSDLSVPTLLYLEKQLVDLNTFIGKLPVLDPAENWSEDPNTSTYRADTTETTRTKKIPRNHIKAPATDKHPAQVEVYTEDVTVGYWKTTKFSGAFPQARIDDLKARVSKLAAAVKMAREEANGTVVTDKPIGEAIFAYLGW